MKRLIVLVLFVVPFLSFGQSYTVDSVTNLVKYEKIFELNGSKDKLFEKALNWVGDNFKSNDVVYLKEKELGQLGVTGTFLNKSYFEGGSNNSAETNVKFDCRFYLKDNKYKVVITKIVFDKFLFNKSLLITLKERPENFLNNAIAKADEYFVKYLADISQYMNAKGASDF